MHKLGHLLEITLHFTEESSHLHSQILVKGMEITDNSTSA